MNETFFKNTFARIETEKRRIESLLYDEYGIHRMKQRIEIVYNRELPYTIIVNNKRKFLYKENIARRTPNIISFDNIKEDFEKCFESVLFPKILNQSDNFYEVEYLNDVDYKNVSLNNLNLFREDINKAKILNYCTTIKNNTYCFVDFDLQNFFFNINTREIYYTYAGDMDRLSFFNPNILSTDTPDNKSTFFIIRNVDLLEFDLSDFEYIEKLNAIYSTSDYNIKFIL